MVEYCKDNLKEIQNVLKNMSGTDYKNSSQFLSGSTIGQHVRHILEFYLCLIDGSRTGKINYDKRERNLLLENDLKFALFTIDKICSNFNFINYDQTISMEGDFSSLGNGVTAIPSSIKRELAYCLEHSIHHQALIKIGLLELNLQHLINANFGVAPATIRYRERCAQ